MAISPKTYRPFELDEQGEPSWRLPIPTQPSYSALGHALPFVHPSLNTARPAPRPSSKIVSLFLDLIFVVPLRILSVALLMVLNSGRVFPKTTGMTLLLQRLYFWAATCYRESDYKYETIKAPVVFPGEVAALPVDASLVEPVYALYMHGLPTSLCYDGYGATLSGIRLSTGEFPRSLIDALDKAGTDYVELSGDGRGWRELVARSADSDFTSVLREWARMPN